MLKAVKVASRNINLVKPNNNRGKGKLVRVSVI
jgi:hypothetical protein